MADKYSSGRPMAKMKAGVGDLPKLKAALPKGWPGPIAEAGMGGRAAAALRLLNKAVKAGVKRLTKSKKPSKPKFDKSKAVKDVTQAMKKGKIDKPIPKAKPKVSKPSKKSMDKYMRQRDRNAAAKAKPSKIPKKGPKIHKSPVTKAPPRAPKARSRKTFDPIAGGLTLASSQGFPKEEEEEFTRIKPIKRSPMPKLKKAKKIKPYKSPVRMVPKGTLAKRQAAAAKKRARREKTMNELLKKDRSKEELQKAAKDY